MPERDSVALSMLLEVLVDNSKVAQLPKLDFAKQWRGIDCDHVSTCRLYGNHALLECDDCASELLFIHIDKGNFGVSIAPRPLHPTEYGLHDADEVMGMVGEFAGTLGIPEMMADRVSGDPDRGAPYGCARVGV